MGKLRIYYLVVMNDNGIDGLVKNGRFPGSTETAGITLLKESIRGEATMPHAALQYGKISLCKVAALLFFAIFKHQNNQTTQ